MPRLRFKALTAVVMACAFALVALSHARAMEVRWTAASGLPSLAPHGLPGLDQQGLLANIYEGLTRRSPSLTLEPALATAWTAVSPTRWRFSLRSGTRFHNGAVFEAGDVVASLEHARAAGSALADLLSPIRRLRRLDDRTVDIVTTEATPDLPERLALVPIVDADWLEKEGGKAAREANGTGPFTVKSFTPNGPLILGVNPLWWDRLDPRITGAALYPAASAAERLRFLLEDRVDIALDLDPDAVAALRTAPEVTALTQVGARTLMLGMRQNTGGATPFGDPRVREAVARAIDVEALNQKLYHGLALPAGLIVAPPLAGFPKALDVRPVHDPERARRLVGEAKGSLGRLPLALDCPTGHYMRDGALCAGIAEMLTRAGLPTVPRGAPPEAYFAKVLKRESAFFLLGWLPNTLDVSNTLSSLAACPETTRPGEAAEPGPGALNLGGYCNEQTDRLIRHLLVTEDSSQRQALAARALLAVRDDWAYVPLVQQPVLWGIRSRVQVRPRADNVLDLRFLRLK